MCCCQQRLSAAVTHSDYIQPARKFQHLQYISTPSSVNTFAEQGTRGCRWTVVDVAVVLEQLPQAGHEAGG